MRVSWLTIIGFGLGMGILSSFLMQLGTSLQYIYLVMGILIGPAVVPIALTVSWKKTNKNAAIMGSILGLAAGICSWISATWLLYGHLSIATTGETTPLLIGNVLSILVSATVVVIGSLLKPQNFNFDLMKQKILVVDDRIRSIIEKDTNDSQLKRDARFTYRYAIALSLVLVVVWPLPLYFSGYVFSLFVYTFWVGLAFAWASVAAGVIILLPLIESRAGIIQVFRKIAGVSASIGQGRVRTPLPQNGSNLRNAYEEYGIMQSKKILVAVDGSLASLWALSYASTLSTSDFRSKIYMMHVMEWSDEEDESIDEALVSQMEQEGRKMLRSVALSSRNPDCERIVKLGDPAIKIAEMADKLEVDFIIMGTKGLGRTDASVGHVTGKVLSLTSRPIILIK
jgi:nucleotide-binding universal stress UspA family protein